MELRFAGGNFNHKPRSIVQPSMWLPGENLQAHQTCHRDVRTRKVQMSFAQNKTNRKLCTKRDYRQRWLRKVVE
jgi:hypothetical protein